MLQTPLTWLFIQIQTQFSSVLTLRGIYVYCSNKMQEWKAPCWPSLSCLCLWPIQTPCWYKPYALPRQPVVFYDETRWDLERDLRRGGKRDGFFLLWHPSGGTTTSDFHFRVKTQGSLSYRHDNKRCFTAHDALCLSTLLHLYDDSLPACLADVFSCLLVDHCVCLPIYPSSSESVCLSACPRVILYLSLYDCQKKRKYNVILLPLLSTTRPNNGCNVQFPSQCDSFTWSIHLLFWTTITSLCIPSVVIVLNVPLCASELALHLWCH